MVAHGMLGRAAHAVVEDWRRLLRQARVSVGCGRNRPGLYTYCAGRGSDRVVLHLRVQGDGSGVLFVNVRDVVYLSPEATQIARMLLDGLTPERVTGLLRRWYPDAAPQVVGADVGLLNDILASLKTPTSGCPTCPLPLAQRDLFSSRPAAPYKADLALTYACNNRCSHCYNEPSRIRASQGETGAHRKRRRAHTNGDALMSLSDWRRVLRRLATIGVPHIIFTGGEPTLCHDLLSLIGYAGRLGQITGLNTNGRRLADRAFAQRLAAAGLDHVQITLASHRADVHNATVGAQAFAETVQGIRNALGCGLHTLTNTTLQRSNCDTILDTVDFIHDLGLKTFAMNGMICAGGGRCNVSALSTAELIPVLDAVRRHAEELGLHFLWYTPTRYCHLSPIALGLGVRACNAAEYSICIEPNGDVLPCQSYYQPAGNILTDDWHAIWNSQLFTRIRHRREAPKAAGLPERCWTCEDLQVCGGGCMLEIGQ